MKSRLKSLQKTIDHFHSNQTFSTLTPFLYNTLTITKPRACGSFAPFNRAPVRHFTCTQNVLNDTDQTLNRKKNSFLDILEGEKVQNVRPGRKRAPDISTLTGPELEIFERLYATPTAPTNGTDERTFTTQDDFWGEEEEEVEGVVERVEEEQVIAGTRPRINPERIKLEEMFDEAFDAMVKSEEKMVKEKSPSLTTAPMTLKYNKVPSVFHGSARLQLNNSYAKQEAEKKKKNLASLYPGLSKEKLEKIAADRLADLNNMVWRFDQVQTDTDLWRLLQRHVFKRMKDLNSYIERVSKANVTDTTNKRRKVKNRSGQESVALEKSQSDISSNSEESSKYLQPVLNLYSQGLLYAMRLFRMKFPRSPYALSVLPMIKDLGSISYVLGGSTAFYNELIYLKWIHYRDLNGCATLLEEMLARNLPVDQRTLAVWREANRTRSYELGMLGSGASGLILPGSEQEIAEEVPNAFAAGWWRLQGVEAGWERWCTAKETAIDWLRSERQRQQEKERMREQSPEDEEDDTSGRDEEVVQDLPSSSQDVLGGASKEN
jgi:hypothetical protein